MSNEENNNIDYYATITDFIENVDPDKLVFKKTSELIDKPEDLLSEYKDYIISENVSIDIQTSEEESKKVLVYKNN